MQVWVANHTSMIDFLILEQATPFAVIMQLHGGWVGRSTEPSGVDLMFIKLRLFVREWDRCLHLHALALFQQISLPTPICKQVSGHDCLHSLTWTALLLCRNKVKCFRSHSVSFLARYRRKVQQVVMSMCRFCPDPHPGLFRLHLVQSNGGKGSGRCSKEVRCSPRQPD